MLNARRLFVNLDFRLAYPPERPERVQRAVDRNPVRPGGELRITAVARQRAENLNPDFLRHVGRQIRVSDQPSHNRIDARRVLRPNGAQRGLVAIDGSTDCDLVGG